MAKNVSTAATTSPLDSMPADTRPRLPVSSPAPSFKTTKAPAANTEANAVRVLHLVSSSSAAPTSGGPCLRLLVITENVASYRPLGSSDRRSWPAAPGGAGPPNLSHWLRGTQRAASSPHEHGREGTRAWARHITRRLCYRPKER